MTAVERGPLAYFFFANAPPEADGYLPTLSGELDRLRALDTQIRRAGVEPVFVADCSVEHLIACLTDQRTRHRIAMVHFAGHAEPDRWMMRGEDTPAHAEGLVALLAGLPGLELVVINGCSSAQQAQQMVAAGISSVVGTLSVIADDAAVTFSEAMHDALAGHETVAQAFRTATDTVNTRFDDARRWRMGRRADWKKPRPQPWALYTDDAQGTWRLRDAVDDPLHGLPQLSRRPLPVSPFRPGRPFQAGDAEVYFGRRTDIRRLYELIVAPDMAPVIKLYGPTGVGKSSLLEAGVLPRVEAAGFDVRRVTGGPETTLLEELRLALRIGQVDAAGWCRAERAIGRPIIAVFDHLDAMLFNERDQVNTQVDELFEALSAVFGAETAPRGRVVLSFVKGYLAEARQALAHAGLSNAGHFLQPLGRDGIIAVVEGPVSTERLRTHYRITLDPALPAMIAADLSNHRDTAVGPVLQLLLGRMIDEATIDGADPILDEALYRQVKDRGLWLDEVFDNALTAVGAAFPGTEAPSRVLDLLYFHVDARDGVVTRTEAEVARAFPHVEGLSTAELIQACVDPRHRLLTARSVATGERTSQLTHAVWAPLVRRRYMDSSLPGQMLARTLAVMARVWQAGHTPLLDDASLGLLDRGLPGMRRPTDTQQEIIDKSCAARDARIEAAQAEVRRKRFYFRLVAVGAAISFFMAVLTTYAFFDERHRANDEAEAKAAAYADRAEAEFAIRAYEASQRTTLDALWTASARATDDHTIAAAALGEVMDTTQALGWSEAVDHALGLPVARVWLAGRAIGFDGVGRLSVVRDDAIVTLASSGRGESRRGIPDDWPGEEFAVGPTGRFIASIVAGAHRGLICDADRCRAVSAPAPLIAVTIRPGGQIRGLLRAEPDQVAIRALDADGTWIGRACDPRSRLAIFPATSKWLFAGVCADGNGWHWATDGALHRWAIDPATVDGLARWLPVLEPGASVPFPLPIGFSAVGHHPDGRYVAVSPAGLHIVGPDGIEDRVTAIEASPSPPESPRGGVHPASGRAWFSDGHRVIMWDLSPHRHSPAGPDGAVRALAAATTGCLPSAMHVAMSGASRTIADVRHGTCECRHARARPATCVVQRFGAARFPVIQRLIE